MLIPFIMILVILPLSILFLIFKVFDLLKSLIVLGRTRCCRFVSTPLSYLARLIAIVQRPIIGLLAMIITMINHSILKGVANSLGQGVRLDRTEQNVWLIYKDTVDVLVIGFSVKKRHPELRGTTLILVKDQNQEIINIQSVQNIRKELKLTDRITLTHDWSVSEKKSLGLTLRLDMETNFYHVHQLEPESPASNSGLKINDVIVSVGNMLFTGSSGSASEILKLFKPDAIVQLGKAVSIRKAVINYQVPSVVRDGDDIKISIPELNCEINLFVLKDKDIRIVFPDKTEITKKMNQWKNKGYYIKNAEQLKNQLNNSNGLKNQLNNLTITVEVPWEITKILSACYSFPTDIVMGEHVILCLPNGHRHIVRSDRPEQQGEIFEIAYQMDPEIVETTAPDDITATSLPSPLLESIQFYVPPKILPLDMQIQKRITNTSNRVETVQTGSEAGYKEFDSVLTFHLDSELEPGMDTGYGMDVDIYSGVRPGISQTSFEKDLTSCECAQEDLVGYLDKVIPSSISNVENVAELFKHYNDHGGHAQLVKDLEKEYGVTVPAKNKIFVGSYQFQKLVEEAAAQVNIQLQQGDKIISFGSETNIYGGNSPAPTTINEMKDAITKMYQEYAPEKLSDGAFVDRFVDQFNDQHGFENVWSELCQIIGKKYNCDLNDFMNSFGKTLVDISRWNRLVRREITKCRQLKSILSKGVRFTIPAGAKPGQTLQSKINSKFDTICQATIPNVQGRKAFIASTKDGKLKVVSGSDGRLTIKVGCCRLYDLLIQPLRVQLGGLQAKHLNGRKGWATKISNGSDAKGRRYYVKLDGPHEKSDKVHPHVLASYLVKVKQNKTLDTEILCMELIKKYVVKYGDRAYAKLRSDLEKKYHVAVPVSVVKDGIFWVENCITSSVRTFFLLPDGNYAAAIVKMGETIKSFEWRPLQGTKTKYMKTSTAIVDAAALTFSAPSGQQIEQRVEEFSAVPQQTFVFPVPRSSPQIGTKGETKEIFSTEINQEETRNQKKKKKKKKKKKSKKNKNKTDSKKQTTGNELPIKTKKIVKWDIAKQVLEQAHASTQSRHVQEQAQIDAIIHQNKMVKRRFTANQRLQKRLTKRGGNTVIVPIHPPQELIPIPQYKRSLKSKTKVSNIFTPNMVLDLVQEQRYTQEINVIREKSELARTSTMQKIEKREIKADLRLQKRLALRARAKQSNVLQNCSPFAKLTKEAQEKIIDKMTYEKINSGEIVCKKGREAEKMYLLMLGKCIVKVDSKKVGDLKELDVFGEAALFGTNDDPSRRSATVIAKSNLEVLVLLRDDLNELMKSGDLSPKCIEALQKVAQKRQRHNIKQSKLKATQASEI